MKEPKITRVILVRHGESKGNEQGLFRGRTDFPLTERGLAQAEEVARALSTRSIAAVYTSPLRRALQTAREIASAGDAPLEERQGLTNMALGPWEGHAKAQIAQDYPEEWELWMRHPERLHLPDSETFSQVQSRSFSNLKHLIGLHEGETFVVVSHRTVLKPMLAACLGISEPYFWRLHFDMASYSTLIYESVRGYTLTLLNETGHLSEIPPEWV